MVISIFHKIYAHKWLYTAVCGHKSFWYHLVGASERTRTPDLRITNALLYRLSYTSILFFRQSKLPFRKCKLNVHHIRAIGL